MDSAVARWLVLGASLVASGAAGWLAVGFMHSPRGVPGPGVSDAVSPFTAAIVLLAAFAVCTLVAVVAGRLLNPVVGMFALGTGLAIASMRTGTIRDASFDGGSLVPLAFESIVLGVLVAIASVVVHLVATPMVPAAMREEPAGGRASRSRSEGDDSTRLTLAEILAPRSLTMAAIGAVSIVGIWLLVTSAMKGQAIGAAAVGGLLAGHVARRAVPHQEPVLLFASPIVIVGVVQLLLAWSIRDPALAFVRGSTPNLVAVMPLDLAAGTIIGVSVGVGLSRPAPAAAAETAPSGG